MAQTTATVTGVVTDPSGAVIPKATVTLSNPSTGVKYTVQSDSAGSYRFANVPPGPGYQIVVSYPGFSPYQVNGLYVNVASARTQNAKLVPGSTVEVKVNSDAAGVTLNTTDATIGNNFQVSKLQDLPVYDRSSPAVLFTLQPGITSSGATTGARTDQTDTTVDGLDVNDFATGSFEAITANAPVDSVQEFRGTTAGFTADSGPGGGGQFQLVTKSGTNSWHGDVNEYHRDNSTTANTWFNNEAGVTQPKLVQNQFGGALGGPIKHNKVFFFFDYLGSRIAQDTSVERYVPLPSYTAGNIGYINNGTNCSESSRANTQPSCISYLTPAQVKALDPAGIGESTTIYSLFTGLYPAANDLTYGDGVNTGGFRFNSPQPDNATTYVGRIDWNATDRIKIYGRGTVERHNAADGASQFPGQPISTQFVDRSYGYVVGMDWQISDSKFNQFAYGSTVQDYDFAKPSNPEGSYQYSFSSGTGTLLDSPYASPSNAQSRHVPIPEVNDNFTWTIGRHTLQMGGYFKWILATGTQTLGYNSYAIGLGGELSGLNPSLEPSNILPALTGTTAQNDFDEAFTVALGHIGQLSSTFNYNAAGQALAQPSSSTQSYRYYQTQPYISDIWKITPHLTVDYGVNYQYFTVPYETHGLESVQNTGFDSYFAKRESQSAAGISGNNAVPFITYVLGGPKNNGPSYYASNPYNFAPHLAFAYTPGFDPLTVFNGSFGIVYDRTVINAVQYQQTQNSYLFQQNKNVQYGTDPDPATDLVDDPRLGNNQPLASAPASPKSPFTPFVDSQGVPYGLIYSEFNSMIDPHLKTPYSMLINFGMQHQFPGAMILKVSYVGRLGRRLLAQADASQLIDFPDTASGEMMSTAMANIEKEVRAGQNGANLPPEPWFEHQVTPGLGVANGYTNNTSLVASYASPYPYRGDFADTIQKIAPFLQPNVGMDAQFSENTVYTNKGFSSYNGLLVTLDKNLTHGLQFQANYTWSHSIDNVSLIANNVAAGGYGFICDAVHPKECRGSSDFDTAHYITGDFTYSLPFGRGRSFGSNLPLALDEVIGGWDVSGIPSFHTGQVFTPLSDAFVAGYANDAPAIFNGDYSVVARHQHKEASGAEQLFADPSAAAAAFTGPVGLQIGSRNILRGPLYFNMDAGLAKNFALWPEKGVKLQFRADAFNVFNHVSFDDLDYNSYNTYTTIIYPSIFGQLTGLSNSPRVVQLSGRIEF